VALPGGDWAEVLGHYTDTSADLLVPTFDPEPPLTTNVIQGQISLANYTASTNTSVARSTMFISRSSAALVQELIAVRAQGFFAQEEVFLATVAQGAKLQVDTFDSEHASELLWSWTSACVPVHYAREHVFSNVLRLARSASPEHPPTHQALHAAFAADIELPRADLQPSKGFGRFTHPFKWDTFADDDAFVDYVAKASKFACPWAGVGSELGWTELLANETLSSTSCDAASLALACEEALLEASRAGALWANSTSEKGPQVR